MDVRGLLTEGFGRITELYEGLADGLSDEQLHHRPGGTGTSAYVHPDGTVAVLLTQVGLGDPVLELLQTFWTLARG